MAELPNPDPIRVLQLVISLEPGGMENGVVNLANGLRPLGIETKILCLGERGRLAERLDPHIEVIALGKSDGFRLGAAREVARIAQSWGADVLHTHNLGPLIYGVIAWVLSVKPSWRIVHGEHGQLSWEATYRNPWNFRRRLMQRQLLFRGCTAIHTVSREMIDDLEAFGLSHPNMVAIPNGVDTGRFVPPQSKEAAKATLGFPANSLIVGNVGRMFPHKRQTLLVEAFDLLAEAYPALMLLFVGDSDTGREAVQDRITQSRFRDRIVCAGFQSNPVPYYQAMDVLAVPSLYEGMSNVVLEAMACGLPVVAHEACGMKEMIRDGESGLVRQVTSGAQLAAMLEKVVASDVAREEMGRRSRDIAVTSFSIEGMWKRYQEVLAAAAG